MSPTPDAKDDSSSPLKDRQSLHLSSHRSGHHRHELATYIRRFSAAIRKKSGETVHQVNTPTSPTQISTNHDSFLPPTSTQPLPLQRRSTNGVISANSPIIAASPTASSISNPSLRSSGVGFTWSKASVATSIDRAAVRDQRAQMIFAKYGLSMPTPTASTDDLRRVSSSDSVLRVEKRARLRMHSTCHQCQTVFPAGSKHCRKCTHKRCRECPRAAPRGVRDLVSQTKLALESIPEPQREPVRIPSPRIDSVAAAVSVPEQPTICQSSKPMTILLVPDYFPSNQPQEEPLPALDVLLDTSCPFTATRKLSNPFIPFIKQPLQPRDPNMFAIPYDPQPRVYRKPRQRRQLACQTCGSMYAGLGGFCAGCWGGRMSMCAGGVH